MAENKRVIHAPDVGADAQRFPYGSEAIYKNWLGAPLISGGEVIGVLAVEKREPHFYNALYEQLALTFANQTAVALNNARLFQETRARARSLDQQAQRLALLNRVSLALAQTLDIENIYEIALREAAIALDVTEGSAFQLDPTTNLGTAIVDYPRGEMPPNLVFDSGRNAAIDRVRDTLLPLVVEQTGRDPLAGALRALTRRQDVKSSLLVPLVVGGEVIGVLRLDSIDADHGFETDQIELAQTIASQAATAAQNAALFEQGQIRTSELETLFESAQATAVTLDLDEVVRRVTVQMLSAVEADACTVFMWDEVNDLLEVRGDLSARPDAAKEQLGTMYHLDNYPLRGRALRKREMIIVRADDENIPDGEHELLVKHHAAARMLIPLVVNEISIV
jgi:GAF domain-containing protein